jgi:hypothetical protein
LEEITKDELKAMGYKLREKKWKKLILLIY